MPISDERFEEIINGIHDGDSIKVLMPNVTERRKFYESLLENVLRAQVYASAQAGRAELLVDDLVNIADTEPDPQKARNRIDARKWVASKLQPQKFGDRLDLNVNQHVDLSGALAEAAKRLIPLRDPEKYVESQVIGKNELIHNSTTDSKSDAQSKSAINESSETTTPVDQPAIETIPDVLS